MATRKKILFVITKANWGGAQRYVFDLVSHLPKEDFEPSVAFGVRGTLAERLEQHGTPLYPIASLQRNVSLLSDIRSFFALYGICRKVRPDIVHLNSSKGGALGALAARLAGAKKIIFTVHGWAFNEVRPAWQKLLITWIHWLTVLCADHTIAVSQYDYAQAKGWMWVGKKIQPIHNGIGPITYAQKNEARSALSAYHDNLKNHAEDFWIGTTSELHTNKGLDFLLHAFAQIAPQHPRAIVVIIGAGEKRDSLQLLASDLGIAPRVFFLGFVDRAAQYLPAFDVFTLTSRKEGLPYALLEAGQAGVPVIASDVGGITEIISTHNEGYVVRTGDTTAISAALEHAKSNPEHTQALAHELQDKIKREFSLEGMVQKTQQVYRS